MKRLRLILELYIFSTLAEAQDNFDQEVDVVGDYPEISQLPRLTISTLFNTSLSEQQELSIEHFLSLPDWAGESDIIAYGKQLNNSLQENGRFSLIKNLIQQKIDRLLANQK